MDVRCYLVQFRAVFTRLSKANCSSQLEKRTIRDSSLAYTHFPCACFVSSFVNNQSYHFGLGSLKHTITPLPCVVRVPFTSETICAFRPHKHQGESTIEIGMSCHHLPPTNSAYRIDLHGLSHVALSHLKQQSSCTGRLFPADALTTRLNSFFSVYIHQSLVIFHYILLDFRTFTIIPQGKV